MTAPAPALFATPPGHEWAPARLHKIGRGAARWRAGIRDLLQSPRQPAKVGPDDKIELNRGQTVSLHMKDELISLLPRLRRFGRTLTRSAAEADDLVQESCLRALSRAHLWDPAQPLDRWMFRIMRNLWISEMRKRKVRLGQGIVPADETDELISHEASETGAIASDLQRQIDNLPDDLSTILLTVSVEGYSYAEAAELLGIPTGTVMSRLHRARKMLAARLAQEVSA